MTKMIKSDDFIIENKVKSPESQFLNDIFNNLKKKMQESFENIKHPIWAYRERQLATVLTPVLDSLTHSHFISELPLERLELKSNKGAKKETKIGWLDYWCVWKKFTYLIEIKQSYLSYQRHSFTEIQSLWKDACNQLQRIENSYIKDYLREYSAYQCFRVPLIVIPIYSYNSLDRNHPEELNKLFYKCINSINNPFKPTITALWITPENSQKMKWNEELTEYYYGVIFISDLQPARLISSI